MGASIEHVVTFFGHLLLVPINLNDLNNHIAVQRVLGVVGIRLHVEVMLLASFLAISTRFSLLHNFSVNDLTPSACHSAIQGFRNFGQRFLSQIKVFVLGGHLKEVCLLKSFGPAYS